MSKHDYNILLHRLRWQTQMDNFVGLETFEISRTSAYCKCSNI